jgi:two-component system chemotaxis sensor kinase CheA
MAESSRDKLLKQFRELCAERLERITQSLVSLESGPSSERGKAALRELHGLKGEARMMGFSDINTLVHEMEGLVRVAEPAGFALSSGSTDALLVATDAVLILSGAAQGTPPDVGKLVEWLKQRAQGEAQLAGGKPAGGAPAAQAQAPEHLPAAPPRPSAPRAGEGRLEGGVRIGSASLDLLTTAVTNLSQIARRRELASRRRLGLSRELAQLSRFAEDLGSAGVDLVARLNRAKDAAAELHRQEKLLSNEELKDLSQLSEEIQALRMLPLSVLFEPSPRMVRDLARDLGKEVELVVEGEDTRADRTVVEALRDPLLHLVRNALDHGVEPPAERTSAGKPAKGHLSLRAAREGERILLSVEDDGRGMDPALLRRAAVRRGLMDEASAAALSDAGAIDLIFVSGFSSKELATDVSGRGVGLDVVRSRLQGLGGDVLVRSIPGKGTSFELRAPVSLTVAPLLFISVGDEQLCLTASHVTRALKVEASNVHEIAGRPAIRVEDEVLPFASIHSILGMEPDRGPSEGELVLLVQGQGATAAISVDRVLEERVQAILPLKGMLSRFSHLSGATPLADGSLAMVLSAAHLISTARGSAAFRLGAQPTKVREVAKRILVVDDSPLTRELICSLLEAVGYQIANAADGQEALEKLAREPVDMVVTDLEMPRMDGLELTRRLKSHATYRGLPVVIITTRGSEADRRRGMEAGADGYIAKGDLVRQDLVDVVARLLG